MDYWTKRCLQCWLLTVNQLRSRAGHGVAWQSVLGVRYDRAYTPAPRRRCWVGTVMDGGRCFSSSLSSPPPPSSQASAVGCTVHDFQERAAAAVAMANRVPHIPLARDFLCRQSRKATGAEGVSRRRSIVRFLFFSFSREREAFHSHAKWFPISSAAMLYIKVQQIFLHQVLVENGYIVNLLVCFLSKNPCSYYYMMVYVQYTILF